MNNDPTIACWGTSHLQYLLLTACLMVPYYFATLELQSLVQVRTIQYYILLYIEDAHRVLNGRRSP